MHAAGQHERLFGIPGDPALHSGGWLGFVRRAAPGAGVRSPVAAVGGHHFGMRKVLLIIREPDTAKASTSGCSVHGPMT